MARPVMTLHTTMHEFDMLHRQQDKTRGKFARVNAEALMHLLMDHGAMIEQVRKSGMVLQGKEPRDTIEGQADKMHKRSGPRVRLQKPERVKPRLKNSDKVRRK